jgi:hypothetical protein
MFKTTTSLFLILISMQYLVCLTSSEKYDDLFEGDSETNDKQELVEKEEATEFLKRTLFHPFHTKNEGFL